MKSITSIDGTPARTNGMWSSRIPPRAAGGNAWPLPARRAAERAIRVRLARDREAPVADEVEQDHRLGVPVGRGGDLAPPEPGLLERQVVAPGRGLLAVEERKDDRRSERARLQRAGELEDDGDARRIVVRADEAREVLRVVVGAEDDDPFRLPARQHADHVPKTARDGLVAPVRHPCAQVRGEPLRRRRAGRPRAEGELPEQHLERGALVEAPTRRLRGGARGGEHRGRHGCDGEPPHGRGSIIPPVRRAS